MRIRRIKVMSDSSTTNTQNTTNFNITSLVNEYYNALQNAYVSQVPTDPNSYASSWVPNFNASLQSAQENVKVWSDSLEPAIFAIPQSIISYNDTFMVSSNDLLNIINSCINNVDASGNPQITREQIVELEQYLNALSGEIRNITKNVDDASNQLSTFCSSIQGDYNNFISFQGTAQQQLSMDDNLLHIQPYNELKQEINVVQGIISSIPILLNYNIETLNGCNGVMTILRTLQEKLAAVANQLATAENDITNENNPAKLISDLINEEVIIQEVQSRWCDLNEYANKILN